MRVFPIPNDKNNKWVSYQEIKENYLKRRSQKQFISLNDARKNSFVISEDYVPSKSNSLGVYTFSDINLEEVIPYIAVSYTHLTLPTKA